MKGPWRLSRIEDNPKITNLFSRRASLVTPDGIPDDDSTSQILLETWIYTFQIIQENIKSKVSTHGRCAVTPLAPSFLELGKHLEPRVCSLIYLSIFVFCPLLPREDYCRWFRPMTTQFDPEATYTFLWKHHTKHTKHISGKVSVPYVSLIVLLLSFTLGHSSTLSATHEEAPW